MTREEFEGNVLELIRSGLATTRSALIQTTHCDNKAMDRCLERLSRRGVIVYDKTAKRWSMTQVPTIDMTDTVVIANDAVPQDNSATQSGNTLPSTHGNDSVEPSAPETTQEATNMSNDVNKIDAAINAANKRKQQGETSEGRPRLSAEERAARDNAKEAERLQRKQERDAARSAKKAQRDAGKKPAHMSKVAKAAERLPRLDTALSDFFNQLTVNFSAAQLQALAANITHHNRVKATERALGQQLKVGDTVKIVGGEPRYLGKTGVVNKAQRIRCYVTIDGVNKPVYLFTSDVEVMEPVKVAAVG